MAASKATLLQVCKVLVEEVGITSAIHIAQRLVKETRGNASYDQTVRTLESALHKYTSFPTPGFTGPVEVRKVRTRKGQ